MKFNRLVLKCRAFHKIAQEKTSLRVSIVPNTDEVLSKIQELKSFDDAIDYLKENFKILGEGSSRLVFDFGKDKILKLAKNDRGLGQNLEENRISAQRDITNKILVADPTGKYNIMHRVKMLKKADFEELTGMNFNDYAEALYYKFNNERDDKQPKNYDKTILNPFFKSVVSFIADCDLQVGDLKKINSYGELNGKAVITDFGLSREVFNGLYT